MISKIVSEIEAALKERDFNKGIDLLREWLSTCQPGEPGQLLDACSPRMRSNVTVLMRDLLSRYPSTLLGCPLLIYAAPEVNADLPVLSDGMALPFPRAENAKPCSDLQFVGWLPCDSQLPILLPLRPAQYKNTVDWHLPTAYVALFRTHSADADLDELSIPAEWWADLFMNGHSNQPEAAGNVRIEGNMLLSYPEALEVAAAKQGGARGDALPTPGHFQQQLNWAHELGVVFNENCSIQFSTPAY